MGLTSMDRKRTILITDVKTCVIAGGVAANKCLRNKLKNSIEDIETIFPDISYCNDNAAMIAFLGEKKSKIIRKGSLGFIIKPNLKLK